jgi:hypothetical protein
VANSDSTGAVFLAVGPPTLPIEIPGTITLPELPGGGSPGTAAAMLIALAVAKAASILIPSAPHPKLTKAEQEQEDGKRVVKVSEVRKALEKAVTPFELSKIIGRILLTLLKGGAEPGGWSSEVASAAEFNDVIPPLFDKIMIEVRARELPQNNPRQRRKRPDYTRKLAGYSPPIRTKLTNPIQFGSGVPPGAA